MTARFVKAGGVKTGSNVMLAGIKVGTVTHQSLDSDEFLAVLELSLASDVKLPDDSVKHTTLSRLISEVLILSSLTNG